MEGTPIRVAGIVFDTYGTVGAALPVMGIVFDTYVGCGGVFMWVLLLLGVLGIVFDTWECCGCVLVDAGYRFRYLGWRELLFVQRVLFSIPGRTEEAFYRGD